MKTLHAVGVVGAGIVGLAVARAVQQQLPGVDIIVFEKELGVAQHQTGRNSGVVHSGVYYEPGSLKARLCVEGAHLLRTYCQRKGLDFHECGKVIVALNDAEIVRLHVLQERARLNGVSDMRIIGPDELREIEPHAVGRFALHSPHTAIVDYLAISRSLAEDVRDAGGDVRLDTEVRGIRHTDGGVAVVTSAGEHALDIVINCAGLHADRIAEMAGDEATPRIVPFRGEYWQVVAARQHLVRGLIYPVPDPGLPFLGVHLTKRVDGGVLLGPNAVLALAREGYGWSNVSPTDLVEMARWAGTWKLARRHWRVGLNEIHRSFSVRKFVATARRYVPELTIDDVVPAQAGVRAQALGRDGALLDDFRLSWQRRVANVRNAPSPAATSSLAIGRLIASTVLAECKR